MPSKTTWISWTVKLAKAMVLIGIIAYLCWTTEPEHLEKLHATKNWGILSLAFAAAFSAVSLTFVRWYLLVRALELKFRLRDAFRLGFLGYLLNFVAPSSVGGDFFKAIFIAREQQGRRAAAVATVVVDRIIGLYALIVVTSIAILSIPLPVDRPAITAICNMTLAGAAIGGIGISTLLFAPALTNFFAKMFAPIPKVGKVIQDVVDSISMYRSRPGVLSVIGLMSLLTHTLFAVSMFLIAFALYPADPIPTFAEHLIIVPLSMVAGAIPLTPGGLGTFEVAMTELYRDVPVGESVVAGVAVAIVFRLITIAVAAVGGLYYLASRSELREVLKQARSGSEQKINASAS